MTNIKHDLRRILKTLCLIVATLAFLVILLVDVIPPGNSSYQKIKRSFDQVMKEIDQLK